MREIVLIDVLSLSSGEWLAKCNLADKPTVEQKSGQSALTYTYTDEHKRTDGLKAECVFVRLCVRAFARAFAVHVIQSGIVTQTHRIKERMASVCMQQQLHAEFFGYSAVWTNT